MGYDLKWGINKEGVFWSFSSTLIVIYISQKRFLNLIVMDNLQSGFSYQIEKDILQNTITPDSLYIGICNLL